MSGHHRRTPALLLACGLAAVALSGCAGGGTASVSGTIKLRGQVPNVKGLSIAFFGPEGSVAAALINPDGTYKALGVPVGDVKVGFFIQPQEGAPQPQVVGPASRLPRPGASGPKGGGVAAQNPIPEKLRDGGTSGISFTVKSGGDNVFDYDIKP